MTSMATETEVYAHTPSCELEFAARLLCWFKEARRDVRRPHGGDDPPPPFMSAGDLAQQTKLQLLAEAEAAVYHEPNCAVCGLPVPRQL